MRTKLTTDQLAEVEALVERTVEQRLRSRSEGGHSRRWLLTAGAGVAAAGVGAVLATPESASAATGTMQYGTTNTSGGAQTTLTTGSAGSGVTNNAAVLAVAQESVPSGTPGGAAIYGVTVATSSLAALDAGVVVGDTNQSGVVGVLGMSGAGSGVSGLSSSAFGIYGQSGNSFSSLPAAAGVVGAVDSISASGVYGANSGSGPGVTGFSEAGTGVTGTSQSQGIGVAGTGGPGSEGVLGSNGGPGGAGVVGTGGAGGTVVGSGSPGADGVGVQGTSGTGNGVQGSSAEGTGVFGISSSGTGVAGQGGTAGGISSVGPGVVGQGGGGGVNALGPGLTGGAGVIGTGGAGGTSSAAAPDGVDGVGVSGSSGSGTGVLGTSTSGSGVVAQGAARTAAALEATNTNAAGAAIHGVAGASSVLNNLSAGAVIGDTNVASMAGIVGVSTNFFGAIVKTAALSYAAIQADNTAGGVDLVAFGSGRFQQVLSRSAVPPTSGAYVSGEQVRDAQGQLWLCVDGGSPGTWQKVAAVAPGATGGSMNMLASPFRLYDSRPGNSSAITTPKQQLQSGSSNALPLTATGQGGVPAGAIGIIGTLTITNTNDAGFLALYPTGGSVPPTSNINWTATGQTVAASYTCALSSSGSVTIYNGGGPTDVILDIAGFIY